MPKEYVQINYKDKEFLVPTKYAQLQLRIMQKTIEETKIFNRKQI